MATLAKTKLFHVYIYLDLSTLHEMKYTRTISKNAYYGYVQ